MNGFIGLFMVLIFFVEYAHGQCSGTSLGLTASVTVEEFSTPGYPLTYSNDLNCTWLIDSGASGQPVMMYSDAFLVDCSVGDHVNIYDGSSITDTPLIENLCLNTVSTTEYITTGRYMLVQFVTDGSNAGGGFTAMYISAPDTSGTGCSTATNLTASSSPSYLTSVGFPNTYQSSSSCRWLITAPGDLSTITFQLEFSDVEFDSSCAYDKMVLYDGSYICENKVMFEHCSVRTDTSTRHLTQPEYTTTSNSLLIIFTSDNSDNYHGFVLRYNATIEYSTTTVATTAAISTTTATTNTCTPCSAGVSSQQQKESGSEAYLMVISAISGAAFVIIVKLTYNFIRYLKTRKRPKKGLIRVQSIAPIPARTQLATSRIPPADPLCFV